jgi:hypothetical protein
MKIILLGAAGGKIDLSIKRKTDSKENQIELKSNLKDVDRGT